MPTRTRWLHRAALLGLALLAAGGYAIGRAVWRGKQSAPRTRSALAAGVLLEYPSVWREAAAAPSIPGLPLEHAVLLGPGASAGAASGSPAAGLLVGSLPAGEPAPLPRSFLGRLPAAPRTAVVNLLELQAYRYSGLRSPAFPGSPTIYAIPRQRLGPALAVCYGRAASASFMRTCEGVVASVTQLGETQSYSLTPDPAYARSLGAALATLDRQRLEVATELRSSPAPPRMGALATRLASSFAAAANALSALEAPVPVANAQASLLQALGACRSAYAALARTAAAAPASALAGIARARASEGGVDQALEGFALLGYGRPGTAG
jgi:hypothetical protein